VGRSRRSAFVAGLACAATLAAATAIALLPARLSATHGNTLSRNPTSGPPGTAVTLTGTLWTPSPTNQPYRIFWDTKGGSQLGSFTPNAMGSWSTTVTIPVSATLGGHQIVACEGYLTEFQDCVSAAFTVTAPPTATPTRTPTVTPTLAPGVTPPTPTDTPPPTATPTPTANPPPSVTILAPSAGATVTSPNVVVDVRAEESSDLDSVTAAVIHVASTDQAGAYEYCGTTFSLDRFCPSGPPFPIVYERSSLGGIALSLPPSPLHPSGLKDGTYQVRVTACDGKDQCATATRNFELDLPEPATPTPVPAERHRLLILRVDFADAMGVAFTADEFRTGWVSNLVAYFSKVSNGAFALEPYVLDDVIRLQERRLYHRCPPMRDMNGDGNADNADVKMWLRPGEGCRYFAEDALRSAISRGLVDLAGRYVVTPGGSSSAAFASVLVVIGSPNPYSTSWRDSAGRSYQSFWGMCGASIREWSNGFAGAPSDSSRPFTRKDGTLLWAAIAAEDKDCDDVAEATDIGAAAHEVGHMVADNADHPAAYNNNHELMDSCYPCYPTSYTRTRATWFPFWLPGERLVKAAPPSDVTVVLAPAELPSAGTPSPQAIKVNTGAPGVYYMVECRRRIAWDDATLGNIPSEGVLILQVMEGNSPETAVMPPAGNISVLWRPGQTYTDAVNDLQIRVGPDAADACTVTVDYGATSGAPVPDVYLVPWLTAPLYAYETVDIWLDSPCNGIGTFRYGQRADGSVIASGDTPCANRENRIYIRIRNAGAAEARNVRGRVEVQTRDATRPGVCTMTGWTTISNFGPVGPIPPGASSSFFARWTPMVPEGASPYVTRTTCIRVILEPQPGELVTGNQDGVGEQEAIIWFEADVGAAGQGVSPGQAGLVQDKLFLVNDSEVTKELFVNVSGAPEDWAVEIGAGSSYVLNPGEEASLPITIAPPPGTPAGQTVFINVEVSALGEILDGSGVPVHLTDETVGGVILAIHTVQGSSLSLQATAEGDAIAASGRLQPPEAGAVITIDYEDPAGQVQTRLVETDGEGRFTDQLEGPDAGEWTIRAFFAGDSESASATSNEVLVVVGGPSTTGDANCDGLVTAIDAALILQRVAGLLGTLPCEDAADVNGNGDIDSIDAALVLQRVAGLLPAFPSGFRTLW
jgi:hypothetical protein